MNIVRPPSWALLIVMPFVGSLACADEHLDDLDNFDAELTELESSEEPGHLDRH